MVYVDLNPIRAGLAATPEESDFTSIQERIRDWQMQKTAASVAPEAAQDIQFAALGKDTKTVENADQISSPVSESTCTASSASWLCPIESDSKRRGILQMSTAEYFALVDRSGRLLRSDKRGAIDADLAPILLRLGANPEAWADTISRFGSNFRLAAGLLSNLRSFADRLGRRWLQGIATSRAAFVSSPLRMA